MGNAPSVPTTGSPLSVSQKHDIARMKRQNEIFDKYFGAFFTTTEPNHTPKGAGSSPPSAHNTLNLLDTESTTPNISNRYDLHVPSALLASLARGKDSDSSSSSSDDDGKGSNYKDWFVDDGKPLSADTMMRLRPRKPPKIRSYTKPKRKFYPPSPGSLTIAEAEELKRRTLKKKEAQMRREIEFMEEMTQKRDALREKIRKRQLEKEKEEKKRLKSRNRLRRYLLIRIRKGFKRLYEEYL
ncbi:hypothetical protein SISNIDRAFT_453861 [Sistotremastrum niveocremeum HHB9708]|uniref:Uncharacterized protein n=1 Tax=Sistotremastrum niveocremeum HHB9708 TaxID=1314777 RepID=A0A164VGE8_9AGAM|nr:hypothetical protein SISNIDRAFT_453861 [Sistotremastrum niveocremeum HHB9708]